MTKYSHPFDPQTSYGSVVRLLSGRALGPGIVLDLGCGYGAIASHVSALGATYVGLDLDPASIDALVAAGVEAHRVDLDVEPAALLTALSDVVAGRPIAAILALDVLEHLRQPEVFLSTVTALIADGSAACFVASIPNVTHVDLAGKQLLGRWDLTDEGLLDRTHLQLFDERRVTSLFASNGWGEAGRDDVVRPVSDQCFPADAPSLRPGAPLRELLAWLRRRAEPSGEVFQFVRRFERGVVPAAQGAPAEGPVLAVLASSEAHVALLDLGSEVLVVDPDADQDLRSVVARIGARYVWWAGQGVRPVGDGSAWVEAIRSALDVAPGRVLRFNVVREATNGGEPIDSARLDLVGEGLRGPFVPSAFAVPASLIVDLGLAPGDGIEELIAFLTRAISLCGRYDLEVAVSVPADAVHELAHFADAVVEELSDTPFLLGVGALAPLHQLHVERLMALDHREQLLAEQAARVLEVEVQAATIAELERALDMERQRLPARVRRAAGRVVRWRPRR